MAQEIVSEGEVFELIGLDRQFGGTRTSIMKASVSAGVPSLAFGIDVSVSGKVTATSAALGAATLGSKPVLAGAPFKTFVVAGRNGAGAIAAAGTKVGDKVIAAVNLTDLSDASASFEATTTVAAQIQQSSAGDLSTKTILFIVCLQS